MTRLRPNRVCAGRALWTPEIQEAVEIAQRMNMIVPPPVVRSRVRVLSDKWVKCRVVRDCDRCGTWSTFGETIRRIVVAKPGGMTTEYSCWSCNEGRRGTGWDRDLEAELEAAHQHDDGSDIPF